MRLIPEQPVVRRDEAKEKVNDKTGDKAGEPVSPPKPTPSPTPSVADNSSSTQNSAPNASTSTPPTPLKPVSGGVLNGKAISLPKPEYPPNAKNMRASGVVTVEVLLDESGKVISARAVEGNPLLRPAAVAAARQARFTPTVLSGQPVKVSGVLTYKFSLNP
jgi:protein TonB